MWQRIKEEPRINEVACAGCGAEVVLSGRHDGSPLCLLCRAIILARSFQARRLSNTAPRKKSRGFAD
jgi:hypothetical protein